MPQLLPTPKLLTPVDGLFRLTDGSTVAAVGHAAGEIAAWLADGLPVACGVTTDPADAQIILGLLDDLGPLGLAPDSARESVAFAANLGAEQGYVLDASPERVVLAAQQPPGLRHAVATLLQVVEGDGSVPCGRIEDWPDFRFRVADWLLNVEINRWGYERGDGRDAVFARMCRKLDLAARHKLNLVWFDGFGWDPDRRPGYADFVRELSRYARSLGIRLAHSGYGGGYGFAYQASEIYTGDYMGRAFENRRPWPDGDVYPCLGHPGYERSWTWGTCLSNDGLLAAKLDDLTDFVRACEPGLLYVHDIDTGDWAATADAWLRRCDDCRRRWPADEVTAADGMAGAYAHWFRMVVDAVSAVRSEDGEYDAARDCEPVFVGPVYTGAHEPDEVWQDECRYFELLSRLIGPDVNLQFGIREQVVSDDPGGPRVAELAAGLDAVGNGHGVMVINFSGGDAYYNDELISPSATLSPLFLGARTNYIVHLGSSVEPSQLIAAEPAWNATSPAATPAPGSRGEAMGLLQEMRAGTYRPDALFGGGGLLERACERLYGPSAGPLLARALGSDEWGGPPVVTVWRSVVRDAGKLQRGEELDVAAARERWRQRARASREAALLVASALTCADLPPGADEDLAWLRRSLELGAEFAEARALACELRASPDATLAARLSDHCAALERRVREDFSVDTFDPVGGDVGLWSPTVEALAEIAHTHRQ